MSQEDRLEDYDARSAIPVIIEATRQPAPALYLLRQPGMTQCYEPISTSPS